MYCVSVCVLDIIAYVQHVRECVCVCVCMSLRVSR